jgi:hypothetical protein
LNIRFIGDVHGKWKNYRKLIRDQENTLQVGDFGVGFYDMHGDPYPGPPHDAMAKGNNLFIRGNHDNPGVCRKHPFWIRDGDVAFDGRVFCVGGTESIDAMNRIEGLNWWPNEQLTYQELDLILGMYEQIKPEIVATHDAPQILIDTLWYTGNLHTPGKGCGQRTRCMFDNMLEIHRPKHWICGHWHIERHLNIKGTEFHILPELGILDLEIQ